MNVPAQPSRPLVTYLFIGINVLLYVYQALQGVGWIDRTPAAVLAWGGNLAAYTLIDQPWRLFTSMFLHVSLLHLAANMYMLLAFGSMVEQRFGAVRFLLAYLLSGLIGSLVSAQWHADAFNQIVAAGASGALMGLCGAYLADWLVARWHNDPHEAITSGGPLVQTIAINLAIGWIVPGIDNACHIGGLLGGFVVGGAFALVPPRLGQATRALLVAAISCITLGGIYARLHAAPSEGLAAIVELREAEKAEQDEVNRKRQAKARLAKQIADARRSGPRTVSKEQAAGTSIALASPVSSLFLMPDGTRIAVTGEKDHTLRFVDLGTGTEGPAIQGQRPPPDNGECPHGECVPNNANAVALTPDGRTAYVASLVANGVGIVDLQAGKMVGSIRTGSLPRAIVLNKAADRAYVLNDGDNTVVAVDLATRRIVGKPKLTGRNLLSRNHPVGLWLAANDSELWVMDESASRLLVLDAATLAEVNEVIVTSGFMNGVQFDRQRGEAWVVGVDAMDQIDLVKKEIEKTAHFCQGVMTAPVALNRDASLLAIAEPHGWVRVVNLHTAATMAAYPFQGLPIGLRFSPDDKGLYFIANEAPRLTVFDTGVTAPLGELVNAKRPERLCTPLE
ncbi:membrane associated rhomboid family serine protease [Pseudoduganella lurida]|uniref:Membrane associated rhomboid family serine protease n=1 Tax=Pseudoduganella lurida TaxID=1036180 RepID=A0A562QVT3_9BURK|nr:rhomboid family intramembrane serine protease [Pseudoduganella lurida]TWI60892.1 membrane associated rhomboid family serine protease [Pseudoduganella lurida]